MMNEIELSTTTEKGLPIFHLRYGGIVETEPPGGSWYSFKFAPELADVFSRFAQRVIWQREGKPDHPITDMAEVGDDARAIARGFCATVCLAAENGVNRVFAEVAKAHLDDLFNEAAEAAGDTAENRSRDGSTLA
jgi:hypothetical protein